MSGSHRGRGFAARYDEVARRYVRERSEVNLYQAALLGRELLDAEVGPPEVAQYHFTTARQVLGEVERESYEDVLDSLAAVLLEVLMVYGEAHQQVRDVLVELQQRYDELDRTKHALERSKAELEEKTAQLVQTGKMNALGELAAGVAHEINQPLNAMKLISQDILRDIHARRIDETALEDNLQDLVEEIRRVVEIVDHMRLFVRKTAGDQHEVLDINEPLEGVLRLIGQQLALHGIDVDKDLSPGLQVVGDRVRLEQVFMNIITNARDAVSGNKADKRIRIRTYSRTSPGKKLRCVVCEIRDNGKGIPLHLQAKVLEPFVTTKPQGEGTGLGLSITQQIMKEHGGSIELESQTGRGTTVKLTFPRDATEKSPGSV